jgi:hypothetical protein
MLDSISSSTRRIAISRSRNSPRAVEFIDALHVVGSSVPTNRKRPCQFQIAHPATPLTLTHRICLSRGASNAGCSIAWARNDAASLSQLGGGGELSNCFLERRWMGRPLPCPIRLRAERSAHMAVVRCQSARQLDMRCASHISMMALRGETSVQFF